MSFENERLTFRDKKFRIMQVADIQEQPTVSPDSVKLLSLAIEREKPDLVVFSGDQIYGLSPLFKPGADQKVRKALNDILSPVVNAGIPFAVTYGNHDRQCGISNVEQTEIYMEFAGFCGAAANGDKNEGVLFLPVYDGDEARFNVVLIDSNGQSHTGEYEPVLENQLESYKKQTENIRDKNGKLIPCMVVQHIPFEEYFSVINEVPFYKKGAVEGFRNHKHRFYNLPEDITKQGGFMYESPATPDRNSGEFEVINSYGNCLAVCVGHDHNNSFVANYKGTDLIYTQGCGFNVYGPKRKRGVRVYDIDISGETKYTTHTVTFDELTSDRVSKPLQEFVLTHIPTSMEQVKRIVIAGTVTTLPIVYIFTKKLLFSPKNS